MSSQEGSGDAGIMTTRDKCGAERCFTYAALIATISLVLGCADGWSEARAVLGELNCGMSREEVASLVARNAKHAEPVPVDSDGLYVISIPSGPHLRFFFSPDGLYAVRATETVGVMEVFEHPRENLCTGERTIRVTVMSTDSRWSGRPIRLNGNVVGQLVGSAVPTAELEVPLGTQQLQLAGADGKSAAVSLDLTTESSHVTVILRGTAAPVVRTDPPKPPRPRNQQ